MGTIEQAALRLEQLRKAGVVTPESPVERDAQRDGSSAQTIPVRAAREVQASAGLVTRANGVPAGLLAPQIDRFDGARVDIDLARLSSAGYITPNAPRSRLAEEFRIVKRPLLMNVRGKSAAPVLHSNRIMITSSIPGEGKTFTSLNLAMSMAMEIDIDVLLVDADAPRPAVLERLGLPPSKGLLDLLTEPDLDVRSVVLSTNVDRLSILPAGTPQERSTELLASETMSQLVERLAMDGSNRILLVDAPPLLASSESRVLAAHMGQVILVIEADRTPQATVAEALATVENCPVVMTLLNRAPVNEIGTYYGSYGA